MEKLLITGIAGGQGRLVARLAAEAWDVCGVDRDEMLAFNDGTQVRVHAVDLRKRKFEDVFRHERPKAVVHLAFVRHFRASPSCATRSTSSAPSACSSTARTTASAS